MPPPEMVDKRASCNAPEFLPPSTLEVVHDPQGHLPKLKVESGIERTYEGLEYTSDDAEQLSSLGDQSGSVKTSPHRRSLARWKWMAMLFTTVIVITALVGGSLGGILHQRAASVPSSPQGSSSSIEPSSTLAQSATSTPVAAGASTLTSTPTSLPVLPTGKRGLSLGQATTSSSSCLGIVGQQAAWSCTSAAQFLINVTARDAQPPRVQLSPLNVSSSPLQYGPSDPFLEFSGTTSLVIDTEDASRGPAYYAQALFDKVVILSDHSFDPSPVKRALDDEVAPDTPWFCYWNATVVEMYVYVTQDNTLVETNGLVSYPKYVKLAETGGRNNTVTPYCQEMELQSDGSIVPLRNLTTGDVITVPLQVNEASGSSDGSCRCEWIVG